MIIDCHGHLLPEVLLEELADRKSDFPSIQVERTDSKWQLGFAGGALTRPIMPRLRETEQRFEWMAKEGLEHQVCGGWLDAFGYELPADEGVRWSRLTNHHLARAAREAEKVTALCTVPLQGGAKAAMVLAEAMDEHGFAGAMIGTQPKGLGGNLDDPDLEPFWQAAHDRDAVIMIHPVFDVTDKRVLDFDMVNAVARLNDLTTAVARLLFSGHLVKYDRMKFVVLTGGAALPYCLGRLMRNHENHPEYADPRAGFKNLYFDSLVFEPDVLEFLCQRVGADRVMLGSDWPFPIGDFTPAKVVKNANLSASDRDAILGGTAAELLGL
jgi:aminocarboxymuconate-semialdehyde decarboxylase